MTLTPRSKLSELYRLGLRILLLGSPFFTIACGVWTINILLNINSTKTNEITDTLKELSQKLDDQAELSRVRIEKLSPQMESKGRQLEKIDSLLKSETQRNKEAQELSASRDKLTQEQSVLAQERKEFQANETQLFKPRLQDVSLLVCNANAVALDRLAEPLQTQIDKVAGSFAKRMHSDSRLSLFWITGSHVQPLHVYSKSSPKAIPVTTQNATQASFKLDKEIIDRVRQQSIPQSRPDFPPKPHRYIVLSNWNNGISSQEDPFEATDQVDFLLINLRPLESEDGKALSGLIDVANKHQGTVFIIGAGTPNIDPRLVFGILTRTLQNALFE